MDNDEKDKTSVSESDSSPYQTKHIIIPSGSPVANIETTSTAGADQHCYTPDEMKDGSKGGRRLHTYLFNELKGFFNAAEKPSTSTNEAKQNICTYVSKWLHTRPNEDYLFVADTFMSREVPGTSDFCKEQLVDRIIKLDETIASTRSCVYSTKSSERVLEGLERSSKVWWKPEEIKRISMDNQPENETQRRVSENDSPSIMCRICYHESWGTPDLGPLVSPCNCRGSVQMVHMACLQRWLSESGTDTCDLCGYRFRVRWIQRTTLLNSFFAWICTEEEAIQLLTDLALIFAMTPLVIFTAHRCLEASHILFVDGRSSHFLLISLLLLFGYFAQVSYYFWLMSAFFYHAQNWMRWWRSNFGIEILSPDTP